MVESRTLVNGGPSPGPLLEVIGLSKHFTGTLALDAIDFDLRRGEVHALLGQNGAGKSTLIKILAGVYSADAGEIRFGGRPVRPGVDALPISFIHQDLGLVDWMTVAENVAVQTGYPRNRFGLISWTEARRAARDALTGDGKRNRSRCRGFEARRRPSARWSRSAARWRSSRDILVLDEPTAALPEADVSRLLDALRRLRSSGIGIIYVTHRLDEVFRIADRVTVLRDGRRVATDAGRRNLAGGSRGEDRRPLDERRCSSNPRPRPSESCSKVDGVVDPECRPGLVHSRRRRNARAGRPARRRPSYDRPGGLRPDPLQAGHIRLDGVEVDPSDPADAMRKQIGFVSSRRAEESIAANMSVRENIYINPAATGRRVLQPIWRSARARRDPRSCRALFDQGRPTPKAPIATLSGGNQQKVVLARWMEAKVRLLVLEEPTIGVDVGSKAEIYHLLQQSLRAGIGGAAALVRFRGSGAHLPSRAGVQPRPSRVRNTARRTRRRAADRGRIGRCAIRCSRSPRMSGAVRGGISAARSRTRSRSGGCWFC